MADNAIDRLIEEMRAAKKAIFAAECAVADAHAAVQAARETQRAAEVRHAILARTMDKHVYDEMPIVQAKMQAHEEIGTEKPSYSVSNGSLSISAVIPTLAAGSAQSAASAAQSASQQAAAAVSIARWFNSKQSRT